MEKVSTGKRIATKTNKEVISNKWNMKNKKEDRSHLWKCSNVKCKNVATWGMGTWQCCDKCSKIWITETGVENGFRVGFSFYGSSFRIGKRHFMKIKNQQGRDSQ